MMAELCNVDMVAFGALLPVFGLLCVLLGVLLTLHYLHEPAPPTPQDDNGEEVVTLEENYAGGYVTVRSRGEIVGGFYKDE